MMAVQPKPTEQSHTEAAFDAWHQTVSKSSGRMSLYGLLFLLIAFGGGGLWAATAPLAGAALATGTVIATGQNKTIQHLEGGIIEEILVKEGEKVETGQILLRLSRAAATANLQRYRGQYDAFLALKARYRAQLSDEDEITFPKELTDKASESAVADIIETQRSEFNALRDELESEISIFEKRKAAYDEEIAGLVAQRASQSEQAKLIAEELEATKELLDQGLAPKTKYLALLRKSSELEGNHGQLTARIARAKQTIAETEQEIVQLKKERRRTAISELRDVQTRLSDVEQQMRAAEEVVRRIEVRAPVKGVVVKMHHNTQGGVVAPGEAILELLPGDATLLIEARVRTGGHRRCPCGTARQAAVYLSAPAHHTNPARRGDLRLRRPAHRPGDQHKLLRCAGEDCFRPAKGVRGYRNHPRHAGRGLCRNPHTHGDAVLPRADHRQFRPLLPGRLRAHQERSRPCRNWNSADLASRLLVTERSECHLVSG